MWTRLASLLLALLLVSHTALAQTRTPPRDATDVMWFYLGYAGFFTLVDDNKWTHAKAEQWLAAALEQAILKPSALNKG